MYNKKILDVFRKHGFLPSRLISLSKSSYWERFPNNLVSFNCHVVTKSHGIVWRGDLDLTEDYLKLKEVAKEIGETLYTLYEMDGLLSKPDANPDELIRKAFWSTDVEGKPTLGKYEEIRNKVQELYETKGGKND